MTDDRKPRHETVAFRMTLHRGMGEEYRRRHDAIWPDVTALLHDAGVLDYRIFLDPDTHHLFAVLTRRVDHTMATLPAAEVMQRWWVMMRDIMETHPDGAPRVIDLPPMFIWTAPADGATPASPQ